MRYASYSPRGSALAIDSIWWTVIALFVPLGPSTEDILMAPDSFSLSIVLWLAIGQCIPILVTGVLWAVMGYFTREAGIEWIASTTMATC
jgi:hypothetical protein